MAKKIMLVCSAGMSTSLLVTKMKKAASDKNKDINIFATAAAEAGEIFEKEKPDIVLLGPQIRYMLGEFKNKFNVPVSVIDMQNYGMMDGQKVLEQALKEIK